MMRDELLQRIAALPAEADVGVQIGDDHLDIADVVLWGDGAFGALRCHANDLNDTLAAWGLSSELRNRLALEAPRIGPAGRP
jgi:hypothetical protein